MDSDLACKRKEPYMNEIRIPPQNDVELNAALINNIDSDPTRFVAMLAPQIVTASYAEREVHIKYSIAQWMLNSMDILHGGILSSMLDTSMGVFTRAFTASSAVTLNLQLSYSASIMPDSQWVHTVCKMTSMTNRFTHVSATAWAEEGKVAATSTGVFYLIKQVYPR